MARKTKEQMKKMGKEIQTLRRAYQKSHKKSSYKAAMKAAGVAYRKKHPKKK